ncbi:MAG: MmcQ/YjbR family DNA-binding protein [Enterobacterales bacterium]|nr:MmcQ/YjbR family DNA-binding protein [Enterobacterales bacterium]
MTYNEFNEFCGCLAVTSHVVLWGGAHVWKVGGKVFAIGGWERKQGAAVTFKTSEQNYYFLSHKQGYCPAPYFANRGMKWIQRYDLSSDLSTIEKEELFYYLKESYRIVYLGLTKKKQKELGLNC